MSASTVHAVFVNTVIGMFTLCGIALTILIWRTFARSSSAQEDQLTLVADHVSWAAALGGLTFLPFVILAGLTAAAGGVPSETLLTNKLLLSITSAGLWAGFLLSRRRHGIGLWDSKPQSLVQCLTGLAALSITLLIASMGGKYARGESMLDWSGMTDLESFSLGMSFALIVLFIGIMSFISTMLANSKE